MSFGRAAVISLLLLFLCGCFLSIEKNAIIFSDAGEDEPFHDEYESNGEYVEEEPPGPLCGNGICDTTQGETCANCPEDCLECECESDGDCPADYVCRDFECVPLQECTHDDDCDPSEVCKDGFCVLEDVNFFCSNGVDDDGNGVIDCDDLGCRYNGCVTVCEREDTDAQCSDGIDNDADGWTDCNDATCLYNLNVDVCPCTETGLECGVIACSNGADDDGDGKVDCIDGDCMRDPRVQHCYSENTNELCSDGMDNNDDGYVDCLDINCQRTTSVTVCCFVILG